MTVTSTETVHLGRLLGEFDEAYARMRRLVPGLPDGPVDPGTLSEAQREAVDLYEALADQLRLTRGLVPCHRERVQRAAIPDL